VGTKLSKEPLEDLTDFTLRNIPKSSDKRLQPMKKKSRIKAVKESKKAPLSRSETRLKKKKKSIRGRIRVDLAESTKRTPLASIKKAKIM